MLDHSSQNDSLRGTLSVRRLEMILSELDALETLPSAASRIVELCAIRGASEDESLVELIRGDLSLTTRILSFAARRIGAPVGTITEAVELLGPESVRSVVLSVSALEPLTPEASGCGLDYRAFRRHCLATASVAEMLVESLGLPQRPEEGFICGLLHDLGKPALLQCLPKTYRRVIEAVQNRQGNIADFERSIVGVDHTIAGKRLAEKWRLGEMIRDVIWLHHHPVEVLPASLAHRRMIAVVHLADSIARREGFGFSGNYTFYDTIERISQKMDLSEGVLEGIVENLPDRISRWSEVLDLDHPVEEDLSRRTLSRANAELGRLNEQLQSQALTLGRKAQSFDRFARFIRAIPPEATLREVLLAVAETGKAGEPVVAYCFDEGDVLAVLRDADGQARWRLLRSGSGASRGAPGDSTAQTLATLLADPGDLSDWVDPSRCAHEALQWRGEWIGGLLLPGDRGENTGEDPSLPTIPEAMAMILSDAARRGRAIALSEELAGASQILAGEQEAMVDAKAFEAIGELAAGAGHELNNPLAVISGRAQLMREKARTKREREMWDLIYEQAHRISDIITGLMEYATPPRAQPEPIEVGGFLKDLARSFSSSDHPQAASAKVDITVDEGVPPVQADRGQLHAAMYELVCNAAAASGNNAYIRLTGVLDEFHRQVLLSVQDRGCGMDEETLAHAWTPFFSSQPAGRRRGLGLATAKRYVENNGGRIWIRSRPGEGTVVYLQLPAAKGEGVTE